ncbi:MAG: sigma factor [Alistipes shahii]
MFDCYYALPLCRFAEFWLRDRASAEEVVLDVYTHVWQHAAELRITVSVRAYLFRAVRNRALNRLRDDRFSYIPFEELGEVFASPGVVADRDRRDHAARGRGRLAAARPAAATSSSKAATSSSRTPK